MSLSMLKFISNRNNVPEFMSGLLLLSCQNLMRIRLIAIPIRAKPAN